MVKRVSPFLLLLFLIFLNCSGTNPDITVLKIAVWGKWQPRNVIEQKDYSTKRLLSPLVFRYLWHENQDFSILSSIERNNDTISIVLQKNINWHNGPAVSVGDIISYLKQKPLSRLTFMAEDSITIKAWGEDLNRLSWYFSEPFILSGHEGNGIYNIADNKLNHLLLHRRNYLYSEYPLDIDISFLGETPGPQLLAESKYDLILQLPISYIHENANLQEYNIEEKNRNSVAALFINSHKVKDYNRVKSIIAANIDREILTDGLLWGYAQPSGYPFEDANSDMLPNYNTSRVPERIPEGLAEKKEYRILVNRNPLKTRVINEIGLQMPSSEIKLSADVVNADKYLTKIERGDFEILFLQWVYDSYFDIYQLWASEDKFSAFELTGIKSKETTDLLSSFSQTWDSRTKKEFFKIARDQIEKSFPVVFLYRQKFVYLSKLGMRCNVAPENWFSHLKEWQMEANYE